MDAQERSRILVAFIAASPLSSRNLHGPFPKYLPMPPASWQSWRTGMQNSSPPWPSASSTTNRDAPIDWNKLEWESFHKVLVSFCANTRNKRIASPRIIQQGCLSWIGTNFQNWYSKKITPAHLEGICLFCSSIVFSPFSKEKFCGLEKKMVHKFDTLNELGMRFAGAWDSTRLSARYFKISAVWIFSNKFSKAHQKKSRSSHLLAVSNLMYEILDFCTAEMKNRQSQA